MFGYPAKTLNRPWGVETTFANNKEVGYFSLHRNSTFHIKPGIVHHISTKNGCTLLETGNYHRDRDVRIIK